MLGQGAISELPVSGTPTATAAAPTVGYRSIFNFWLGGRLGAGGAITVSPTAIASAEAIGSPTITRGSVTRAVTAIASAEAIGAPRITSTLLPSAVASTEAIGSPTVTPGSVTRTV